ncbi:MAG: HAD family hydrolase [Cyanophyceae cyanobacterium]
MTRIRCQTVWFSDVEAVLFDKDGTLEDSQDSLRELAQKRARLIDAQVPGIGEPLLMAFGVENNALDPTGLMAVGSRFENEIAAAAYIAETGRSWFEAKAIARSAFAQAQHLSQPAPLFAGSLVVLQQLHRAGLKLGILSADSTAGVQAFIDRHQLSSYLELAVGVEPLTKPDPALFIQACTTLGVSPQKTLMVGDSQGDVEMAKQAGAAGAIGICWGQPQVPHLRAADVTVASLDEIQVFPT